MLVTKQLTVSIDFHSIYGFIFLYTMEVNAYRHLVTGAMPSASYSPCFTVKQVIKSVFLLNNIYSEL